MVACTPWMVPQLFNTPQEPFKRGLGPDKYLRDIRCIWGWLLRVPSQGLSHHFPYDSFEFRYLFYSDDSWASHQFFVGFSHDRKGRHHQSFGLICTTAILQEVFDFGKYDCFNAYKYGGTNWRTDNLWMFTSEIEARFCPIRLHDSVFR